MVTLKVDLPEKLNSEFREAISKYKGYKKGAIKESVIEAIQLWIKSERAKAPETTNEIDVEALCAEYSNQYLLVKDDKVVLSSDSLSELLSKVPDNDENYTLITPEEDERRNVSFGWGSKYQRI